MSPQVGLRGRGTQGVRPALPRGGTALQRERGGRLGTPPRKILGRRKDPRLRQACARRAGPRRVAGGRQPGPARVTRSPQRAAWRPGRACPPGLPGLPAASSGSRPPPDSRPAAGQRGAGARIPGPDAAAPRFRRQGPQSGRGVGLGARGPPGAGRALSRGGASGLVPARAHRRGGGAPGHELRPQKTPALARPRARAPRPARTWVPPAPGTRPAPGPPPAVTAVPAPRRPRGGRDAPGRGPRPAAAPPPLALTGGSTAPRSRSLPHEVTNVRAPPARARLATSGVTRLPLAPRGAAEGARAGRGGCRERAASILRGPAREGVSRVRVGALSLCCGRVGPPGSPRRRPRTRRAGQRHGPCVPPLPPRTSWRSRPRCALRPSGTGGTS